MAILRHRFSVQIPQHCWNLGRRGRHASAPCLSGRCHLRVRRRPSHESKRRRPLQCTAPSSSQEQVGFLNKSLHSFRKSGNFMAASKWRTGPQTTGSQRRMPEVVGSLGWLPTPQERSVRPSSTRLTGYTHSSLHHSTPLRSPHFRNCCRRRAGELLPYSALSICLAASVVSVPAVCPADEFTIPFHEKGTIALSLLLSHFSSKSQSQPVSMKTS